MSDGDWLAEEWVAVRNDTVGSHLGLSALAIARAGGIGMARVGTSGRHWQPQPEDGRLMIIVPVKDDLYKSGTVVDLVAFDMAHPDVLYLRTGCGKALGIWCIDSAHKYMPRWRLPGDEDVYAHVVAHRTTLHWLRAQCVGFVILDEGFTLYLLHGLFVDVDDTAHGLALRQSYLHGDEPRIFVRRARAVAA